MFMLTAVGLKKRVEQVGVGLEMPVYRRKGFLSFVVSSMDFYR